MAALPVWGLATWLAAGLAAAGVTFLLLPRRRRPGRVATAACGLAGALAGGLAATALGFGGVGAANLPGAAVAALAAALAVLLVALARRDRPHAAP